MRGSWFFFGNINHESGLPDIFPIEPSHLSQGFGGHLVSHIASFIEEPTNCPDRNLTNGALNHAAKFAGTFFLWFSTGFNQTLRQRSSNESSGSRFKRNLLGLHFGSISRSSDGMPVFFSSVASTTIKRLWREIEQLRSHPVVSAAAAFVPPLDHMYVFNYD